MFDPYAILGVKRGARTETIKRAFRELSKQHHPDVGGDRRKFQDCQRAFEILTDPVRRKRFDETGDAGKPGETAEAFDKQALGMLCQVLAEVLTPYMASERSMVGIDFTRLMRDKLNEITLAGKKKAAEAPKIQERLDYLAKRFRSKDGGDNPLRSFLEREIASIEKQLADVKAMQARVQRAGELLSSFEFDVEKLLTARTSGGHWIAPMPSWLSGAAGHGW